MTCLAAHYDHQCRALVEHGTADEKRDALEELVKRALAFSPAQHRANRAPRAPRETEQERAGTWGWGGRV